MKKEDKYIAVEQITRLVNEYEHFYVSDISTLNSEDSSALRRACFKEGIKLYMVKNTLLKKALESFETDYSPLYETLKGNTALMFCNTGNLPAKLIKSFRKDKSIPALKAACVEGSFYIGAEHLETLVHIKSKAELTAELVALLQSPAQNVVSALQSGGTILHGVLETLGEREN